MKTHLLVLYIIFISKLCSGQPQKSNEDTVLSLFELEGVNVLQSSIKLPKFEIDPCILSIIKEIIEGDTICNYYRKDTTGYCLSVVKFNDGYQIGIGPTYLDRIPATNYSGIFELNGRKFLCWGETPKELFHILSFDSVRLWSYTTTLTMEEIYLGGDQTGNLKSCNCNNSKLYFLTRTCNYKSQTKKVSRKFFWKNAKD